jgi:DNA-binding MurR/RpiR family transcriptional regulator
MLITDRDVFVRVRFVYASLPKAERVAADLLLDEGPAVVGYTLSEYAEKAKSSEASVIRFCRRVGAKGFAEFKQLLEDSTEGAESSGASRIGPHDDLRTVFQKIAMNYERTLEDTLSLYTPEYDRALEAIQGARTIHFFGVGDAHLVCEAARMKFARVGRQCTAYSDTALMLSAGSLADASDVVVAVSFTGRTRLVVDATALAKANGATIICILHNDKTKLGKLADIQLLTATTDVTPARDEIARRIAEHAIVDTLYMAMVVRNHQLYGISGETSLKAIEDYK